jgi:hypothetical protein
MKLTDSTLTWSDGAANRVKSVCIYSNDRGQAVERPPDPEVPSLLNSLPPRWEPFTLRRPLLAAPTLTERPDPTL